ncbi:hypothetical protein E9993_15565 [Labilibacter sediminis]|nr:hypothetical protein E9993_15565 [Labilibacter sediminis]
MQQSLIIKIITAFILAVIVQLITNINYWSLVGFCMAIIIFIDFINNIGKTLLIKEAMLLFAAIQWVIGPFIEFQKTSHHYLFKMYVTEEVYMSYLTPTLIGLYIGLNLIHYKTSLFRLKENATLLIHNHPKLPYILIGSGFILPFFSFIIPGALGFVVYLVAQAKYIGVILLLFSTNENRWKVFWGMLIFAFLESAARGMFHAFLLWGVLIFTFVAYELKFNLTRKIWVVSIGLVMVLTLQSVKNEYRQLVWYQGYSGNKIELFFNLAFKNVTSGSIFSSSQSEEMTTRMNQGWIISKIMSQVPKEINYANGSTIWDAIEATILPRFLAPHKKVAGGKENFEKYTGLDLQSSSSMDISLAGEGYINYGPRGGIVFMLVWGLFIAWFISKCEYINRYYPTFLLWLPLLFLQVVKAETSLIVVLNYLIKAFILQYAIFWFVKRKYGIIM